MYDKYTARPAVFLSCNFIEFSPFYSALNIVFGGPRGILCTRGAYGHLQKVDFFIFSKILAFSGRLFLCFFEYRNIMCAD